MSKWKEQMRQRERERHRDWDFVVPSHVDEDIDSGYEFDDEMDEDLDDEKKIQTPLSPASQQRPSRV